MPTSSNVISWSYSVLFCMPKYRLIYCITHWTTAYLHSLVDQRPRYTMPDFPFIKSKQCINSKLIPLNWHIWPTWRVWRCLYMQRGCSLPVFSNLLLCSERVRASSFGQNREQTAVRMKRALWLHSRKVWRVVGVFICAAERNLCATVLLIALCSLSLSWPLRQEEEEPLKWCAYNSNQQILCQMPLTVADHYNNTVVLWQSNVKLLVVTGSKASTAHKASWLANTVLNRARICESFANLGLPSWHGSLSRRLVCGLRSVLMFLIINSVSLFVSPSL